MQTTSTRSSVEKFLTFRLHGEPFGIAVPTIREIIRIQKITPMVNTPAYVRGVINLRGRIVPIVDLRTKFGMEAREDGQTCIVVVEVRGMSGGATALGLVVDKVDEVMNLKAGEVEPAPDFGLPLDTAYLLGMAKVRDEVVTLIDMDRVFTSETLAALTAAA